MEATELRIGNIIYIPKTDQQAKISLITEASIVGVNKDVIGIGSLKISELKPILLTEEFLLNFGFNKLSSPEPTFSNGYMIIYTDETTGYKYFEYGIGENKRAIRRSECRFVHQLQNLCYSLTGTELSLAKNKTETNNANETKS